MRFKFSKRITAFRGTIIKFWLPKSQYKNVIILHLRYFARICNLIFNSKTTIKFRLTLFYSNNTFHYIYVFSPDEVLKRLVEMQFNDSFYYWRKNTQGKNREKSFWEIDESEAEETTFEWILRFFCFLGRKVSIKVFDFMFLIFDYFSAFGLEGHHCQRVKKLHWTIPATTTKQNEILKMINFFFLFFVIE